MKAILLYLLDGLKYFALQTLIETILIVILMYIGLPYSNMVVGGEPLWEVIIGVLGYHALFKSMIFSFIYLLFFVSGCLIKKFKSQVSFSLINGVLSLILPVTILYIRDLTFLEMLNVFIATVLASFLIIIGAKLIANKKTVNGRS